MPRAQITFALSCRMYMAASRSMSCKNETFDKHQHASLEDPVSTKLSNSWQETAAPSLPAEKSEEKSPKREAEKPAQKSAAKPAETPAEKSPEKQAVRGSLGPLAG